QVARLPCVRLLSAQVDGWLPDPWWWWFETAPRSDTGRRRLEEPICQNLYGHWARIPWPENCLACGKPGGPRYQWRRRSHRADAYDYRQAPRWGSVPRVVRMRWPRRQDQQWTYIVPPSSPEDSGEACDCLVCSPSDF